MKGTETQVRKVRAADVEPGDRIPYDIDPRGYVVVRNVADGLASDRTDRVVIVTDGPAPTTSHQPDALVAVLKPTPPRPRTNDLVDITIRGGRVRDTSATMLDGAAAMVVHFADGKAHMVVPLDSPDVTITRVTPAVPKWWPPQPEDLLKDRFNRLWWAFSTDDDGRMLLTNSTRHESEVPMRVDQDQLLTDVGPLTLVRREQQGGAA